MNLKGKIVTVRPEVAIDTLQRLPNYVGISEKSAGSSSISMNVVIIPAGAKAQPHYHEGFETAIYLLKGDVQTFYGENLAETCINKQGDFIYIPAGLPHMPVNLSDTEDAIALVARNDANEQESVREYIFTDTVNLPVLVPAIIRVHPVVLFSQEGPWRQVVQ